MTLAEVYAAAGYTPRESDRPSVGMDYVITSDDWITIGAAEYKNVSVKESIPYGTEEIKVDTIPRGEKRVISNGENGEVTRTYTVEYINGQETNRTFAYEETTKWAVNEKYEIGVGGSFTNANGITYTYNYRRTVPATYYNLEGLTYLGQMADESVIAVDPNNIPLGTKVYVKNDTYDFGVRVAADTGPKVDEWQIDIWLSPYNPQYASFAQIGYHNDMEIYYLD
jgi:3D (Asp-Asp-Asp) domain-containing protein